MIAVALPWALVRAARSPARWAGWLLLGYTVALVVGMRYYLSVRFIPPSSVAAAQPAPSPQFVLEMAGLSAEALTLVAVTLLLLAVMVEVIAPGPVGRLAAGSAQAQAATRASEVTRSGAREHRRPGGVVVAVDLAAADVGDLGP